MESNEAIEYTQEIIPKADPAALEEARHWTVTQDDEGGVVLTRDDR